MSQHDLKDELNTHEIEPLLPIEKKLIIFSLGAGLILLAILYIWTR